MYVTFNISFKCTFIVISLSCAIIIRSNDQSPTSSIIIRGSQSLDLKMMRTKVGIRIRTAVLLWTTVLINFLTVSAERTLSLSDFFSGLSPPLRGGLKGIVQSRSNHVEDASARIVVTYKDCDGDQECINVKDFRKVLVSY